MAIERFTVSKDDSIYEAWPDLVLTDGGKLICVFTECTRHSDRQNSRLALVESIDRGRTWSRKKYLTERCDSSYYFNCARITKLRDGTLAILCDKLTKSGEARGECRTSEIHLWVSDREGIEWHHKTVFPFCGIVPDKLRELSTGRLIISAHFDGETTGKLEQYLWYSDDRGTTWSDRITVAASDKYNLCEACLYESDGGTLIALMRENSLVGEDILMSISHDFGESWSELIRTPIPAGHRPTAGRLMDGRIMISYRFIPALGLHNAFIAVIDEDQLLSGKRSVYIRVMPLDYDRNPDPDTGYTGWAQFSDGEIYVVNYIKDDAKKAHIRGYSLRPEDIELPIELFGDDNFF